MTEQKTELSLIIEPEKILLAPDIDTQLEAIRKDALSIKADLTTKTGRATIISAAFAVAKIKTTIDKWGMDHVADQKKKLAEFDGTRKKVRDYLDALKDEVRGPVTAYEKAEEERVNALRAKIQVIQNTAEKSMVADSAMCLKLLEDVAEFNPDEYQELSAEAGKILESSVAIIKANAVKAKRREDEAAELEKLRKEKAERDEADRIKAIQDKAAKEAREQAEREAKAEQDRKDREAAQKLAQVQAERDAIEAKAKADREQAERDKQAAIDKAEREKREAAEQAERDRLKAEAEKKAADEKEAARVADENHRNKIHDDIIEDLEENGFDTETAGDLVNHICNGLISHVSINY